MALTRSNSAINKRYTVTKTTNYISTLLDDIILCDATSANFDVTLPLATTVPGKELTCIKIDSSSNVISILGSGGQTVNGNVGVVLSKRYNYFVVISDGANWKIVSENSPTIITLRTANGYGSTNTKIRLFGNVVQNIGSGVNASLTNTLGTSLTIVHAGLYTISYTEIFSSSSYLGISLNSTQLTTSIDSITATDVLTTSNAGVTAPSTVCTTVYLVAGDVIRPHTSGVAVGSNGTIEPKFSIARVW